MTPRELKRLESQDGLCLALLDETDETSAASRRWRLVPGGASTIRRRLLRFLSTFLTCLAVMACAADLRADLIVTVGDSLVSSGGAIDYLPVYISSNAGLVELAATSFEFQITSNGSTPLQFVNSPAPPSDPTFSNSHYVFSQISGDQAFAIRLGAAITSDAFLGGDGANNPPDYFASLGATRKLLGMLPITTLTNTEPPVGDTISVSLVPYSTNDPFTLFADDNANSIPISTDSFSPAQTTVTPEPSTLSMLGLGLAGWTVAARRRRKARLAKGATPGG